MASGFFRGVSSASDFRFGDASAKTKRALAAVAPPEYAVAINMRRVLRPLIEGWAATRVTELLGIEDEVVVGLVTGALQVEVRRRAAGDCGGGLLPHPLSGASPSRRRPRPPRVFLLAPLCRAPTPWSCRLL